MTHYVPLGRRNRGKLTIEVYPVRLFLGHSNRPRQISADAEVIGLQRFPGTFLV